MAQVPWDFLLFCSEISLPFLQRKVQMLLIPFIIFIALLVARIKEKKMKKKVGVTFLVAIVLFVSVLHLYQRPSDYEIEKRLSYLLMNKDSLNLAEVFEGAEIVCLIPFYSSTKSVQNLIGEKIVHYRITAVRMIETGDQSWWVLVKNKNGWNEYRMTSVTIPESRKAICTKVGNAVIKRSEISGSIFFNLTQEKKP